MEEFRIKLVNCVLCGFPVEARKDKKGDIFYKCRNCECMLIVYSDYGLQKLIELMEKQKKEREKGVIKSE